MDLFILLYWVLAALLCVMMFHQGMTRKVDLFSIRNIYIAGFIVSQLVSPALALKAEDYHGFSITDPMKAGKWLILYNYIYISIYLLSYHKIGAANWLAKKFPRSAVSLSASDSLLMGLAISTIIVAMAVRIIGLQISTIAAISVNISLALASVACAIIGWVWAARRVNPIVLLALAVVVSVSVFVALSGMYSRRPLISVLAGLVWGVYHRWLKHQSPTRMLIGAVPAMLVVFGIVGAFTAARSHKTSITDAATTVQQMRGASVSKGTSDLLGGQAVGAIALWVIDSFPSEFDYRPLFGIKYMFYWWVPRAWWKDKPEPLSTEIATLAKLRGVNRKGITLPPGVVGYACAEGGFYAVVIYALFFGQFTRFFDSLVTIYPTSPFVILPVGCSTGQFLGLARGDISTFATLAVIGFATSFLLIYCTAMAFGPTSSAPIRAPRPEPQ